MLITNAKRVLHKYKHTYTIYSCVKREAFTAVSIQVWLSGYENEQFYDGYSSFGGT